MPLKTSLRWKRKAQEAAESKEQTASPTAIAARDDLALFADYVAQKPPAEHHKRWIESLVTGKDSECLKRVAGKNLEILSPRGSAKSTWMAMFAAWTIGHNPNAPIIYVSYSESVALSRSRIVKRIIESDRYQEVFPNIRPGCRWADTDWEINKELAGTTDLDFDYTFYATGILGSITSRRSAIIIYDDLIKSSESIANPDIRARIANNIGEVLRPTLIPGGREIDIGTRFRADDIHATEFTEERGWEVLIQPAIIENPDGTERSYWEERFKLEKLQELREDKPSIFAFQYQNNIVRISDISIDPNWIVRGPIPEDPEWSSIVVGADLSSTEKEKSDFTVFILMAKQPGDPHYYILDMRRGKWGGNVSKLNVLLEMLADWNFISKEHGRYRDDGSSIYHSGPQTIHFTVESTAYQASLQGDFKDYVIRKHGIENIVYRRPKTVGDKLSRLRGISGLFENRLVVFNEMTQLNRVIKELENFGSIDHDDCVDAMVHGLKTLAARGALQVVAGMEAS